MNLLKLVLFCGYMERRGCTWMDGMLDWVRSVGNFVPRALLKHNSLFNLILSSHIQMRMREGRKQANSSIAVIPGRLTSVSASRHVPEQTIKQGGLSGWSKVSTCSCHLVAREGLRSLRSASGK